MSERYLVTGVQLGVLLASNVKEKREQIITEITEKQFIGNSESNVKDDADLISEMLDK